MVALPDDLAIAAPIRDQWRDAFIRALGRRMTWAIAGLLASVLCLGTAVADEIPPEGKGTEAVALIFAATYSSPSTTISITVNSTVSPPEAWIKLDDYDFLLKRNANEPCRFDLGSAVLHKDEWPTWGERAAMIRFDRLSSETETQTNLSAGDFTYNLTVFGAPGEQVVCNTLPRAVANTPLRGSDKPAKCYDRLTTFALRPDRLRTTLRALSFVFTNVCAPVELPLSR